ncbi:FecR domain-containing protein [Haloferula sp. A504]|uniref:FecR domain-containing protein n=1 Tax=Haloferula sp. A504 TaxID=3373601 RepID=UPI0031C67D4F|nr:FecR domain-containing protein [Verrucomicrobiaceae bacterium E54]
MKLQPEPQPDREFVDLVQRVLDHEASLEDIAHLNARLPKDSVALRYFVEMRMLHCSLEDAFDAAPAELDSIEGRLVNFSGHSCPAAQAPTRAQASSKPQWRKWLVAAAALVAISLGFLAVDRFLHRPAFEVVARHGTGLSAVPAKGTWIRHGDTLELKDNAVEIRSADGNTLTFQGPGELKIQSRDRLILESGRLWADLKGDPVKIITPRGEVTDLGTTFGIDQSSPFATRIDVFDGEVRFTNPDDAGRTTNAEKGESLVSSGAEWTPERGEADAGRYTSGIRRPIGLSFVKDEAEAARISSKLAFGAAWATGSSITGTAQLPGSPVEIRWSGGSIFSTGAWKAPEADVLHTHLCCSAWRKFRIDAPGGDQQAEDESVGITIHLQNLATWMEQIGAVGYKLTVLQNSNERGVRFFPISVFEGGSGTGTPVGVFETQPEAYLPGNYPDGPGGLGARVVQEFPMVFKADSLTLKAPPFDGAERLSNISGIVLNPVF